MSCCTEEEAWKKWCPLYRVSVEPGGSADNRGNIDNVSDYRCRTTGCMAWRWLDRKDLNTQEQLIPNQGYCGLAGRP